MTDPQPAYLVDRSEGVLTLSFNRPEHGNAIPASAVPELIDLFSSINGDPSVRAILIRGEGKTFSAGGDVKGFARSLEQSIEDRRADFRQRLDRLKTLVEVFIAVEVPIVAACRGGVAGAGLMYALGADFVLADDTAAFVFAHQRVGLTPDGGVSLLLPRIVGVRRALELILGAAKVDAHEAYRIGIVSRIVPAETLEAEALKQARRLASAPASVVRTAKRLVNGSLERAPSSQLEAERDAIVESVGQPAFEEGVRAFLEKRAPDFVSRG